MNRKAAQTYFEKWLDSVSIGAGDKPDVPMLKVDRDGVSPILSASGMVARSEELTSEIKKVGCEIVADWNSSRNIEGTLYLIYSRANNGSLVPHYLGKCSSAGKDGKKRSTLWPNEGRFGEKIGSMGHIGNLNEALFQGKPHYAGWVEKFFENPGPPLRLKFPVFVYIEKWTVASTSIIHDLPLTLHNPTLHVEESLRIWVIQRAFGPDLLLNRDGIDRR